MRTSEKHHRAIQIAESWPYKVILLSSAILLVVTGCAAPTQIAQPTSEPTATRNVKPTEAVLSVTPTATDAPVSQPTAPATETPPTATATTTPTPATTMRYDLVFEATWSSDTHPTDFPSNPHFSGLIGAVHRPDASIWEAGGIASPGMRTMAETGGKRPLEREIIELIDSGTACAVLSGDGIPQSPGSTRLSFTADIECSAVTIVTMIAPSPDWFVGVTGLDLLESGQWVDQVSAELLPWDAGTDSGASYTSANSRTDPQQPINIITSPPLLIGDTVPPLGTLRISRSTLEN